VETLRGAYSHLKVGGSNLVPTDEGTRHWLRQELRRQVVDGPGRTSLIVIGDVLVMVEATARHRRQLYQLCQELLRADVKDGTMTTTGRTRGTRYHPSPSMPSQSLSMPSQSPSDTEQGTEQERAHPPSQSSSKPSTSESDGDGNQGESPPPTPDEGDASAVKPSQSVSMPSQSVPDIAAEDLAEWIAGLEDAWDRLDSELCHVESQLSLLRWAQEVISAGGD
jgi:molybdopterin synthase catalytic subunit